MYCLCTVTVHVHCTCLCLQHLCVVVFLTLTENFEHNDEGEVTLKGFLDLHEKVATDESGGERELWTIIEGMGYDRQLKLLKVINNHTHSLRDIVSHSYVCVIGSAVFV